MRSAAVLNSRTQMPRRVPPRTSSATLTRRPRRADPRHVRWRRGRAARPGALRCATTIVPCATLRAGHGRKQRCRPNTFRSSFIDAGCIAIRDARRAAFAKGEYNVEKCAVCHFYDRNASKQTEQRGTQWGQCRRSAPMLHPINQKAYMIEGVWPHVRDDDWCGEWKSASRRAETRLPDVVQSGPLFPPAAHRHSRPSGRPHRRTCKAVDRYSHPRLLQASWHCPGATTDRFALSLQLPRARCAQ